MPISPDAAALPAAADEDDGAAARQAAAPQPFFRIVPNSDGSTLDVVASDMEDLGHTLVYVNVGIGPTGYKEGWSGTYSSTVEGYAFQKISGFTPTLTITGSFNITTITGVETPDLGYERAFLPKAQEVGAAAHSEDERLELEVNIAGTLPDDLYVAVTTNANEPGPLPPSAHLIGGIYSVSASGQLITLSKPLDLSFLYSESLLNGADPNTLVFYAWQPTTSSNEGQWYRVQSQLSLIDEMVTASIDRFTTYAVFSLPRWETNFDEVHVLDVTRSENIDFSPDNELVLNNVPGVGHAVSQPITPSFGLSNWETAFFTVTATSPNALLSVDLLDAAGNVVLANVTNGQSLTSLDAQALPALRLRAVLTATTTESPRLQSWGISWQNKGCCDPVALIPLTVIA